MTTSLRTDHIASTINDMSRADQNKALSLLIQKLSADEIAAAIMKEKFDRVSRYIARQLEIHTEPGVRPSQV